MGVFTFLLKTVGLGAKYGVFVGGAYSFFGYFYAQEIKYRLGDEQHCQRVDREIFVRDLDLREDFAVSLAMGFMNVYHFYMRTWLFRQFEQDCREFHRQVIASILRNYEEYGVFGQRAEM
jgi:hypothetical protein